jgi:hypothetical protein
MKDKRQIERFLKRLQEYTTKPEIRNDALIRVATLEWILEE